MKVTDTVRYRDDTCFDDKGVARLAFLATYKTAVDSRCLLSANLQRSDVIVIGVARVHFSTQQFTVYSSIHLELRSCCLGLVSCTSLSSDESFPSYVPTQH